MSITNIQVTRNNDGTLAVNDTLSAFKSNSDFVGSSAYAPEQAATLDTPKF